MNKKIIKLIIDESGAKGFSDKTESLPGELGIIAGYLIPEEYYTAVQSDICSIKDKYITDKKLHITDLSPQQQEQLRAEIFNYFKEKNVYWTYEAIYVEGFHQNAEFIDSLKDKAKAERTSSIKLSGNRTKDLLHSELFLGAFGKGIAFCLDYVGNEFRLDVITDNIDKDIMKRFNEEAHRLLSVGERKTRIVTGCDPASKKVLKGSISTEVVEGKEAFGDFSGVSFTITCEDSALTLAADVLANSVFYHLKQKQANNFGQPLNSKLAIEGHPIASLAYGTFAPQKGNYIVDAVYMHPKEIDKLNSSS